MPNTLANIKKRLSHFIRDGISFAVYLFRFRMKGRAVTLVYHSVDRVGEAKDTYRLNVTPERFEEHLKLISNFKDSVEITFDDGFGNNYEYAFPLLKKYGFTATVFLITDFIDGKIESRKFCGKWLELRPLTWEEIRIMDGSGIRFGSHTKTHPVLAALSRDNIRQEFVDSKKRIEAELGHAIGSLAYPLGGRSSFNAVVEEIAAQSGYGRAYTNVMGVNTGQDKDNYHVKRVRIHSEDSPLKLKMKLAGAYDWVDLFPRKIAV